MDDRLYLSDLYDYYGVLLTEKQQLYFEDYYFNNFSLAEISDNYGVSRNAIHKQLRDVELKLKAFEEKLKLYDKGARIKVLIENIDDNIKEEIKELI
ncbi:MAG: sigma factor-like helix-turn-helix DNA-binding protein [Bacilli bacterium]|nr:sigma factor-like helix-turn-helix DNA-binding protein [Bacilli bacterium]